MGVKSSLGQGGSFWKLWGEPVPASSGFRWQMAPLAVAASLGLCFCRHTAVPSEAKPPSAYSAEDIVITVRPRLDNPGYTSLLKLLLNQTCKVSFAICGRVSGIRTRVSLGAIA